VDDVDAAAEAIQKLVEKFMPSYGSRPLNGKLIEGYRSSIDGNAVSVYSIVPDELTAKENATALDVPL
jgi:nitroimidazol reductase NimA-like FMN-containing flavoprotein (pyridoxamine 5'-phosphate oxidase superfamily)